MSRAILPLYVGDISAFARSLRTQLAGLERTPGHVELLNMLARSNGYRNFQHLRAQLAAREALEAPAALPEPVDHILLRRLTRYFDAEGRLVRWPSKHSHREPCLWAVWSRIEASRVYGEPELNERLKELHLFGDHTFLRRMLCDQSLLARTADCREYRRIEGQPATLALALIRHLRRRPT